MTAPTEETSWAWLLPSLVSALSALVGVSIGGWITTRNQKIDRRYHHLQEQLGFYGTMLGMRKEIRAKSEVRKRIQDLSNRRMRRTPCSLLKFTHDFSTYVDERRPFAQSRGVRSI
jgi:hypothetical protein